jgi:molybdopterin synthase catalytic subunit
MGALDRPSLDAWLREMKSSPGAGDVGMYLSHNGVVRAFSRDGRTVTGMEVSVDGEALAAALEQTRQMPGIRFVRAWVNSGHLEVGDDIMYAVVAGDIRENVFDALQALVRTIKTVVVTETELR